MTGNILSVLHLPNMCYNRQVGVWFGRFFASRVAFCRTRSVPDHNTSFLTFGASVIPPVGTAKGGRCV